MPGSPSEIRQIGVSCGNCLPTLIRRVRVRSQEGQLVTAHYSEPTCLGSSAPGRGHGRAAVGSRAVAAAHGPVDRHRRAALARRHLRGAVVHGCTAHARDRRARRAGREPATPVAAIFRRPLTQVGVGIMTGTALVAIAAFVVSGVTVASAASRAGSRSQTWYCSWRIPRSCWRCVYSPASYPRGGRSA
jgi:hypothetical protein